MNLKTAKAIRLKPEVRRRRYQWAWVTLDVKATVHECRVLDVSQDEAKIVIDLAADWSPL
jgi:hypothetical protein